MGYLYSFTNRVYERHIYPLSELFEIHITKEHIVDRPNDPIKSRLVIDILP